MLVELEKDLPNFQLTIGKKSKTIEEYIKLLKLAKQNKKKQKKTKENVRK